MLPKALVRGESFKIHYVIEEFPLPRSCYSKTKNQSRQAVSSSATDFVDRFLKSGVNNAMGRTSMTCRIIPSKPQNYSSIKSNSPCTSRNWKPHAREPMQCALDGYTGAFIRIFSQFAYSTCGCSSHCRAYTTPVCQSCGFLLGKDDCACNSLSCWYAALRQSTKAARCVLSQVNSWRSTLMDRGCFYTGQSKIMELHPSLIPCE